jgi:hypothetical protein
VCVRLQVLWEVNQRVVLAIEEARKISWANLDPEGIEKQSIHNFIAYNDSANKK